MCGFAAGRHLVFSRRQLQLLLSGVRNDISIIIKYNVMYNTYYYPFRICSVYFKNQTKIVFFFFSFSMLMIKSNILPPSHSIVNDKIVGIHISVKRTIFFLKFANPILYYTLDVLCHVYTCRHEKTK